MGFFRRKLSCSGMLKIKSICIHMQYLPSESFTPSRLIITTRRQSASEIMEHAVRRQNICSTFEIPIFARSKLCLLPRFLNFPHFFSSVFSCARQIFIIEREAKSFNEMLSEMFTHLWRILESQSDVSGTARELQKVWPTLSFLQLGVRRWEKKLCFKLRF